MTRYATRASMSSGTSAITRSGVYEETPPEVGSGAVEEGSHAASLRNGRSWLAEGASVASNACQAGETMSGWSLRATAPRNSHCTL
jgi:hypothetical protein